MLAPTRLAAVLLALALAGCARSLMTTPVVYQGLDIEPGAERTIDEDARTTILYATDRRPTGASRPANRYADARGLTLRLGLATLRIGEGDRTGDQILQDLSDGKRPPSRLVDIEEFGEHWRTIPLSDPAYLKTIETPETDAPIRAAERRFVDEVNSRLGPEKRALVYVHGFNTPFTDPLRLMAELNLHLDARVVPIAFSWPSRSTFLGYSKQVSVAEVSVRNLRELLLLLAEQTDAERIDILSYSAGAPLASDALHQLRLMAADDSIDEIRSRYRLGRVIYAGADEDFDRFRNFYLDGFGEVARSITVYFSQSDAGLSLSTIFTRGTTRLGRAMEALTEQDLENLRQGGRTTLIDVSRAQSRAGAGSLGHSYWYANPWVLSDVLALLLYELPPSERCLEPAGDDAYWQFHDDYPEQIRAVFRERESEPD